MSADYQYLSTDPGHLTINAYWLDVPEFGFHWHYHPELEITYIKNGRGNRIVGDNVNTFEQGDFVFLGSNLPHTWISDDDFNQSDEHMEVAVLQFHPDLLSGGVLKLGETENIRHLLSLAGRGVQFKGEHAGQAATMLGNLVESSGIERFNLLLTLLDHLGQSNDGTQLASVAYIPPLDDSTEERILNVCRYLHETFTNPIKLETVAKLANMNPAAFCRFFRKSTGQSLSEYVNDLRIGKACNLLLDKNQTSISGIGYQSGFNSQTLFNRIFLRKKGMTPSTFRKVTRR